jgi:hypothetical protein
MQTNSNLLKMLNKVNRRILLDRLMHKKEYIFNEGQTVDMIDISKDFLNYTIIKLKPDVNKPNYAIFVMIQINKKVITHQMIRYLDNEKSSNNYIKELKKMINISTNEEIIKVCYEQSPTLFSVLLHKKNIVLE